MKAPSCRLRGLGHGTGSRRGWWEAGGEQPWGCEVAFPVPQVTFGAPGCPVASAEESTASAIATTMLKTAVSALRSTRLLPDGRRRRHGVKDVLYLAWLLMMAVVGVSPRRQQKLVRRESRRAIRVGRRLRLHTDRGEPSAPRCLQQARRLVVVHACRGSRRVWLGWWKKRRSAPLHSWMLG